MKKQSKDINHDDISRVLSFVQSPDKLRPGVKIIEDHFPIFGETCHEDDPDHFRYVEHASDRLRPFTVGVTAS